LERKADEFVGEENSSIPLTSFSKPSRKRGRPVDIDDSTLFATRDRYVHLFEQTWGLVGWDLQTAKTLEDLRAAMSLWDVSTRQYYRTELFIRHCPDTRSKSNTLRAKRTELSDVRQEQRDALQTEQEARRAVERVSAALRQCESAEQRLALSHELTKRQTTFEGAQSRVAGLYERHELLIAALEEHESQFAQSELLDFIRTRRYAFAPLNIANAIAGLPYIAWRQSHKRCARIACKTANSPAFEIFELIQSAVRYASARDRREFTDSVRQHLAASRQDGHALSELKKHWYYFRKAIEGINVETVHPKHLPYRLAAEYQLTLEHPSAIDLALEDLEQIS
jgi:hypothetical protein